MLTQTQLLAERFVLASTVAPKNQWNLRGEKKKCKSNNKYLNSYCFFFCENNRNTDWHFVKKNVKLKCFCQNKPPLTEVFFKKNHMKSQRKQTIFTLSHCALKKKIQLFTDDSPTWKLFFSLSFAFNDSDFDRWNAVSTARPSHAHTS